MTAMLGAPLDARLPWVREIHDLDAACVATREARRAPSGLAPKAAE